MCQVPCWTSDKENDERELVPAFLARERAEQVTLHEDQHCRRERWGMR